jgi:hypothetical protein
MESFAVAAALLFLECRTLVVVVALRAQVARVVSTETLGSNAGNGWRLRGMSAKVCLVGAPLATRAAVGNGVTVEEDGRRLAEHKEEEKSGPKNGSRQ